ncbi:MAG: hexokinase [Candidatus Azobacteroides sp.]|nr:hexokinase [Candidatus Azobacteroides sp.]
MKKNIFKLSSKQLKEIATALQSKIEKGLLEDNTELKCIPTYISPKTSAVKGKALVLDLGGTNYRTAVVDFTSGTPVIHPDNGFKKDLSIMKKDGFTQEQLFKEQADPINEMKVDEELPIGYCFSYPANSLLNGDAELINWTKGVNIKEMIGKPVGEGLLNYLNGQNKVKFSSIKVINDTVASLFAGLSDSSYDAYIGLIVGTGTNMAAFMNPENIKKLNPNYKGTGLIPVNLESGNFHPPHLTAIDDKVDACSDSKGRQRFEKAVSGMYLGEILKSVFPCDEVEEKFDAQKLTSIMGYPDIHKKKYVNVSRWIYERSAKLVASSLVGLLLVMLSHDPSIKRVCLTAEGSLFWSEDRKGKNYKEIVLDELQNLLAKFGYSDVKVDINQMDNANLIGSAIAALS